VKPRNKYRPHPELSGVSILTITRLHCHPDGDQKGPREVEVLLDSADVAFAERHTWYAHWTPTTGSFRATTAIPMPNGQATRYLHRMLLAPEDSRIEVDHANGVTTDNRRVNLRIASRPENCRNRRVRSDSSSGASGVCWDKQHQCWRVRVGVNGKNIFIGLFAIRAEAVAARLAAEAKYHGEFAFSARSLDQNCKP
jgi:hypothetical protein